MNITAGTNTAWAERQAASFTATPLACGSAALRHPAQAPTSIDKLKHLRSLPKGFERSRWGEAIVEAVERGLARDVRTLPRPRAQNSANGTAAVELLKVLLRMVSERHHVAPKVIATVDDLERIAADDHAKVPALSGWRRELFGEKAIALKHGKLALAIEKGKVAAVERESGSVTP